MERITPERPAFHYNHGEDERTACSDVTTGETCTELGGWTTLKAVLAQPGFKHPPLSQTSHLKKECIFISECCNSYWGFNLLAAQ